jgi:hypothetical protein
MILASFLLFILIIRIVLGNDSFKQKIRTVVILSLVVVVLGMAFGKYGAQAGLKWWVYYPIPMLVTVLVPPLVLKMNSRKILVYLVLSMLSAPVIHAFFSFFLGWDEYMPFWDIPYYKTLI